MPGGLGRILLVGAGGFVGAILRYGLGGAVQAWSGSTFPWGTLCVNASGCFVIGVLSQIFETQGPYGDQARAFLVAGVLGGYTTFSAFGNETINLIRDGHRLGALLNAGGQVALGLLAVVAGRFAVSAWR